MRSTRTGTVLISGLMLLGIAWTTRTASSSGSCGSRARRWRSDSPSIVGHGELQSSGNFARIQHGEDVGVLQAGGEADLAEETLGAERGGELGVKHLERDRPVCLRSCAR